MKIEIPKSLDLNNSLKFCEELEKVKDSESLIYDYNAMVGTVEPFGMLLVGSKIRNINSDTKHSEINYEDKMYAANMGYFHSVRKRYGKSLSNLRGNKNFMPIKKINIRDSYKDAFDKNLDIYPYIEQEIASKLATVLCRKEENLKSGLVYCITEILRNIYDHSKSKELWYAGQYWPQKDLIEIAILDEGIGISESLKRNKKLQMQDQFEALSLAIMPGISKKLGTSKGYDIYANSGFGLYMLKSICEKIGSFVICSNNSGIVLDNTGINRIQTQFTGTAIRIRIKASKVSEINELIANSRRDGQMLFEKYEKLQEISLDIISDIQSSKIMVK